jgi:hypothetical protein
MSSVGNQRTRRWRHRKKLDRLWLPVEVNRELLVDWLSADGYLQAWDEDDRSKVQEAFQRAIDGLLQDAISE